MKYCDKCYSVFETIKCPNCNNRKVREVLEDDYCFLIEKEVLWAEMLMEVFEKENIPYIAYPTYGAGLSIKMGLYSEIFKFYVPYQFLNKAVLIVKNMFKNSIY